MRSCFTIAMLADLAIGCVAGGEVGYNARPGRQGYPRSSALRASALRASVLRGF